MWRLQSKLFQTNNKLKSQGVGYLRNAFMDQNCKLPKLNLSFLMDEFCTEILQKILEWKRGEQQTYHIPHSKISV